MKKYSHLFLFVVLLNATTNAQHIQLGKQSATAPENLSKAAVTALQNSLGKAAVAISPMAMMTKSVTAVPAPATLAPNGATGTEDMAPEPVIAANNINEPQPVSGRGIRKPARKRLKGQTTGNEKIDEIIVTAASRHRIEPLLLFSVMSQESAFNHQATSPKGARGLMQLMPATAARFGVKNILDPEQNIHAGARYLRFLLDMFNGDISLALAGYNAGEGAVKKYGYSVPPYRETMDYVRKIKRRYIDLSSLSD